MIIKLGFKGNEYELPFPLNPTVFEARLIKRKTGLRMGEFQEAMAAGDSDAIFGAAIVVFYRQDPVGWEQLANELEHTPDIELEFPDPEDEVETGPPAVVAPAHGESDQQTEPETVTD